MFLSDTDQRQVYTASVAGIKYVYIKRTNNKLKITCCFNALWLASRDADETV